jgi:hypothetical protein
MADVQKPINIIIRAFQVPEEAVTPGALRRAEKVINDYAVAAATDQTAVKIKQISVIGSDSDHTIFGIGDDNKPYVWDSGHWIVHA